MPRTNRKSRGRVSQRTWYSQFEKLATTDPEISKLMPRGWAFYGEFHQPIPILLYTFVSGVLPGDKFKTAMKPIADLARQMDRLATALRQFNAEKPSAVFVNFILQLAHASRACKVAQSSNVDEEYARLPNLLSGLAWLLRILACKTKWVIPPNPKLTGSRALVLLYLHFSCRVKQSEYCTASQVATLLRAAYEAAGLCKDANHELVKQRVRRFKAAHADEFTDLKRLVEEHGIPNNLVTLIVLLMRPFSVPR